MPVGFPLECNAPATEMDTYCGLLPPDCKVATDTFVPFFLSTPAAARWASAPPMSPALPYPLFPCVA